MELSKDDLKKLGINSRNFYKENYEKQKLLNILEKEMELRKDEENVQK